MKSSKGSIVNLLLPSNGVTKVVFSVVSVCHPVRRGLWGFLCDHLLDMFKHVHLGPHCPGPLPPSRHVQLGPYCLLVDESICFIGWQIRMTSTSNPGAALRRMLWESLLDIYYTLQKELDSRCTRYASTDL